MERGYQAQVGTHPLLGDFSLTPTVLAGGRLDQINVIPATRGAGARRAHRARASTTPD